MRLSIPRPVLCLAILSVALIAVAVPATASDDAPIPSQETALGAPAADCGQASPSAAALPAPDEAPVCTSVSSSPTIDLFAVPIAQQGPPIRQHYCRCGCGVTCTTDADCGPGGSCVAFVTCC